MTNAPERIWIEDEFGDGDDDQWTYGTWDVRNYRGYVVEYVRADIVQDLTAAYDQLQEALSILMEEYVNEVDPYRVAGFYRDPETEDCVVNARDVLNKKL